MMVTNPNSLTTANSSTLRKAKPDGQMEHRSKSYSSTTGSPPPVTTGDDFDDPLRSSKRTPKACDRCRHKKTKCTGESPCQRCRLDNTVCSFTNRRPKEGPNFNPQVAQKDAAMKMLYKCIEVMNRQILAARLGPYTDPALAEFAESEDFIIGIILDRFGISPVLDEFHSQPVYLPGQRGYNPDNCAVEFPHYIGYWEELDEDSTPSTPQRVFNASSAIPQNMTSSATYPADMQIEENHVGQYQVSEIEHDPRGSRTSTIGSLQRHHTYTYGQDMVKDSHRLWLDRHNVTDESIPSTEMYGIESNNVEGTPFNFFAGIGSSAAEKPNSPLCAESGSAVRGHPTSSRRTQAAYHQQQVQIERIRREQGLLYHSTPHRPSNTRHSPTLPSSYSIPAHMMQAAESEAVVTSQWDTFPATGPTPNYPSTMCSVTGSSPEIVQIGNSTHLSRTAISKQGRAVPVQSADQTIIASSHVEYLDISHGMGGATIRW